MPPDFPGEDFPLKQGLKYYKMYHITVSGKEYPQADTIEEAQQLMVQFGSSPELAEKRAAASSSTLINSVNTWATTGLPRRWQADPREFQEGVLFETTAPGILSQVAEEVPSAISPVIPYMIQPSAPSAPAAPGEAVGDLSQVIKDMAQKVGAVVDIPVGAAAAKPTGKMGGPGLPGISIPDIPLYPVDLIPQVQLPKFPQVQLSEFPKFEVSPKLLLLGILAYAFLKKK